MTVVYAEDVGHYWKTSRSGSDKWMERIRKLIIDADGLVYREGFGREDEAMAFMLEFALGNDVFKIIWPVLPSKKPDTNAAKVQAATALYHDVKTRVVSAKWLGTRAAFMAYLVLGDGVTASQATSSQLATGIPRMLTG